MSSLLSPDKKTSEAELEGLDKLQTDTARSGADRKKQLKRTLTRVLSPLAAVVVLILIWQLYVWLGGKRQDVVPGPLDVAATFGQLWEQGTLQQAVWTSVQRGLIGFVVSAVIGTALGLLFAQVRPLRTAFGPLISGLQVLPSVAWVPAAIIWFGLSDGTVYFVLLMGAIPSIINGLISGVDQVPPQFRSMGTVLGASKTELSLRIILPAALPGYLSGLKQGWAFSWRSLMAAEIIAIGGTMGFGLGTLLQQGRDLSDMGMVMAAILMILLVGIVVELAIFAPIERKLLRGRGLLLN
ncbi:NitT/TauT family transport system permease protein [Psychromicrobium silvestre]|uniref:NitT/TauT family transport system permease protein n=1 Tax=Psychromicrobium silvestre TaxID=1645614 RepID=A0A7Y9LTS4_9MICC|nr:ABC transporter permease [Psychromicrobium silvestre]NYE95471.1 NitT/TauT family transport system permease protein [Psychromicrobium silvestre]